VVIFVFKHLANENLKKISNEEKSYLWLHAFHVNWYLEGTVILTRKLRSFFCVG